jgi:hypothetical protein
VGGEFNIITSLTKKIGGIRRLDQDSQCFKEIVLQLQMVDLETTNVMHA